MAAGAMTYEQDREDLAHHEAEIAAQETFNYAVLDEGETELLGCVYLDPPEERSPPGTDAVVVVVGGRPRRRHRPGAGPGGRHPPLAGRDVGLPLGALLPVKAWCLAPAGGARHSGY